MTKSHPRLHQMKHEALGPPPWPGPGLSWLPPLAPKQTQAEENFTPSQNFLFWFCRITGLDKILNIMLLG